MAASDTAKLVAELSLKDKLTPGVNTALRSVGRLEKGLGRSAKGLGQLGGGLLRVGAIAGGAAAVGLIGGAKAAIDFEDAFAGLQKTVDETDLSKVGLSFDKLKKSIIDMSTRIPVGASDLARLGEAAGALGVKATDIDNFIEITAKLGVTTNLTADQAAEDFGKLGTILGLTGKQYNDVADILVNLGNKGASTESEILDITKRFAASGKAAGLSTAQILAYASAISSAGAEPESAGSSLTRLFNNIITETALATDKGKAFAKVTGKSFKEFSGIVEKDTNGAMLLFLKNLAKLDKFDAAKALKAVGITGVRDRNAILLLAQTYEKNLIPAIENAENATGALDKESTIRFNTIKNKFALLKNAFIKGGITIGDGFLPALGRLTTKVTEWVNTNSGKLEQVGKDIGKALDDIDWKEVERGANRVADAAKVILDVVKQIPTEVKLGGAAFLGLDKLSGGLIGKGVGNIAGGAVDALMKRFIDRGSSPANPVWVASVAGGVGAGGLGGGGKLNTALGIVGKVFIVGVAAEVASLISGPINQLGKDLGAGFRPSEFDSFGKAWEKWRAGADWPFGQKNAPEWLGGTPSKPAPTGGGAGGGFGPVGATGAPRPAGSDTFRSDAPEKRDWRHADAVRIATEIEKMHAGIVVSLSPKPVIAAVTANKSATIAAGVAAKNAAGRTTAATHGVARAVDRKDLSVTVQNNTAVRVAFSTRAAANAVFSRSTHKIL